MLMRIGYVLSVFPKLSESFILNEITELLSQNVDIQIFSVSHAHEDVLHDKYQSFNFVNRSFYFNKKFTKTSSLLKYGLRYLLRPPLIQNFRSKLRCVAVTSQFMKMAQKLDISLFHAHFASESAVIAMYLSESLEVPFTFTTHAWDLYSGANTAAWSVKRQLLQKLCEEAAGIVSISNYNREFLIMNIGVNPDKITVIHCGIDPNDFKRTTPYMASKQILCVARLVEKKGVKYLIEAMSYLVKKHLDAKLNIVGTGPEEETLKKLASDLKVKDKIQFLGDVTDATLRNLYERSSIFVLPCVIAQDGDRDGIPVALMEAMSMELPVISTPISGIPELISDEENGLLVEPKNPVALAEAIDKLLEEPETCKRLGKQGRMTILERFNIKKNVLSLKKFFQTCLEGK